MKTIGEIRREISGLMDTLQKEYSVSQMQLFGSYVRGEEQENSDLDILVEFSREVSLLDVVGLELFLSDTLGIKTDVVLRRSVRREFKDSIFSEAVSV